MKKVVSLIIVISILMLSLTGCGGKSETAINVVALKGPTAMGLVKLMKDSSEGKTESNLYNFEIAASADEVTPGLIQGNIDIACVPANLASVLYNKTEGEIVVLAINTLGVIYIIENGDTVTSVSDLSGRTIYASGKGATPEYALNYMLSSNGIDPESDVTVEYKSEHTECLNALLNDEGAVAMLPQPFVTTALMSNDGIKVALDMTKEWEKSAQALGSDASLITGVCVARKSFVEENKDAVKLFMKQYEKSVDFTNESIDEAADLIEEYGIIKAAVAKKAIPFCNITFISGDKLKKQLSGYLNELLNQNPQAVGGKVPGEDFYY